MIRLFLFFLVLRSAVLAQDIPVIKADGLNAVLNSKEHEVRVINFWATWCAPCIKELPLFEAPSVQDAPGVHVVLVNLDFADKIDKVRKFINRKNIRSEVLLLDDLDYNSWIDKVDASWSGAIPATLIMNTKTGKRIFVEKELADGDLEKLIAEIR